MKSNILIYFILLSCALASAQEFTPCQGRSISNAEINKLSGLANSMEVLALCEVDYNKKKWDDLLSKYHKGLTSFEQITDEKVIYLYLLRMAKPGGFEKGGHLLLLNKILKTPPLRNKFAKEIAFAIQQITLSDPPMEKIFNFTLEKVELPLQSVNDEESCRSKKEKIEARVKSFDYAYKKVASYGSQKALPSLPSLIQVMIPSLIHFDKEKQDRIIKPLYKGLAEHFSERFPGVSISKATAFSKKYIYDKFGRKGPASLTDATSIEAFDENNIISKNAIVLSSHPIQSKSPSTGFLNGIYYAKFSGGLPQIEWSVGKDKYVAKINKVEIKEVYVEPSSSPDYKKMWADKELTGLVLLSSNLEGTMPILASNYLAYYTDKGFKFEEPVQIEDTKEWLKKNIEEGHFDYIIKEAHNRGSESSLIALYQKQTIVKGSKKNSDGKMEIIYILAPKEEAKDNFSGKDQRILYGDLGAWLKTREKGKGSPLLYVNSTCFSMNQAKNEVPLIGSKLFVPIASPTTTTTFSYKNKGQSGKYHILEALLNGKDYQNMREGLMTTSRHKKGLNQFVFPDQPEYLKYLGAENNRTALQTIEVHKNGSPEQYFLDDAE